jgi:hypothetical protein
MARDGTMRWKRGLSTMPVRTLIWTSVVCLLGAGAGRAAEADPDLAAAERTLRDANVGTDGPALLAFLRQRTLSASDQARLADLVRHLGARRFKDRERASRDLRAAGRPARPFLWAALNDADPEIARRAERCLHFIEDGSDLALAEAAARVLAVRRPAGAAAVLLAYLPLADDDALEEALREALAAVGLRDGKADAALVAALKDESPARRAAAAFALGRAADQRPAVRRLLEDADGRVRFQAARALFRAGDRAGVPTLIAFLGKGPVALAQESENLLCLLTGDAEPPAALDGDSTTGRRDCARKWAAWWQAHGDRVDLVKLQKGPPVLGITLVCSYDGAGSDGRGKLRAIGRDDKVRWELDHGLGGPLDAHLLPNGHVLISEHQVGRVTERDRKGNVVWEKKAGPGSVTCQRLANGNTFLATYTEMLEVTRQGKTVFAYRTGHGIYCATKLRNGRYLLAHCSGYLAEIDKSGKEVRKLQVGSLSGWCGVEELANGHFLVAKYGAGQVLEFDRDGNIVWKHTVQTPAWATRLRNGNTLIASAQGHRVIEVDRQGKEVWKREVKGRPFRVRRY